MVEIATARLPQAHVMQADAVPMPFPAGAFDRVFTSLFFHHLSQDERAAFVLDARRVAGELIVVEDARRPAADAEPSNHHVPADGSHDHMHRHSFTASELADELGDGHVLHESHSFVVVAG